MIAFTIALLALYAPGGRRPRARSGQGLVEYALIIVLIAVAVIMAMSALSGQIQAVFGRITASLAVP
jgi:Flp pilus assembly pilin Flp